MESIPSDYARLISEYIDSLEENPRPTDSKKLKGDAGYSLRVGAYRVLYDIDDKAKTVTIIESSIAARHIGKPIPSPKMREGLGEGNMKVFPSSTCLDLIELCEAAHISSMSCERRVL